MKTRRESIKTEPVTDSLPTGQQRVMAQLKTALLNLNKKHGTNMSTEMLSQILQTINVDFGDEDKHKPVYADVPVDTDLSSPPVPEHIVKEEKMLKKNNPFPNWFSFDEISKIELAHFGPLFSMDEERWKVYLLTRNDVVRVAEEFAFLDPSMLRARMHPKDDAALVFEIWKFMTKHGVINRNSIKEEVLKVAESGLNGIRETVPVPPQSVSPSETFTPLNCTACHRECRFICYKPLPPPPQSPEEDNIPMEDEPAEEKEETGLFCHDCTPPFFQKIPLRLFIDSETRNKIIKGEYEEVGIEDLKNFVVMNENKKIEHMEIEKRNETKFEILKKIAKAKPVPWEGYSVMIAHSNASQVETKGGLEILDPTMQEALTGAGSKIRGSVLIEQQVRNIMYGSTGVVCDEESVTCPISIERAFELLTLVIEHAVKSHSICPAEVYLEAKKIDPLHAELVLLIYRICEGAKKLKTDILSLIEINNIKRCVEERIEMKREFIESRKNETNMTDVAGESLKGWKSDLFTPRPNVPLASNSSRQLKLVRI